MQSPLIWRTLVLASCLLWMLPARAEQGDASARLSQAFAAIDQTLAAAGLPGVVVATTDRGHLREVLARGYADLKTKTPLTADTPFAIGSISKSFTAVALMQLYDEGRFDPQAPLTRYLPWLEINSRFAPITGHQVLSHTAGLPFYFADLSSSRYAAYALRNFSPTYAPGAHFLYSNAGFQLLGYVLEDIDHTPYRAVIDRRVLQRLGMNSTFAAIDDSLRTKIPVSYVQWPYDSAYVEAPWFEYGAADGSIVTTAADLCAYARFILNRGANEHGRVLSPKAFELLTTPVAEHYAYGLRVRQENGDTVIGHSGSIAGFEAHLEAHMNDGFAVVVLSNASVGRRLERWIMDTVRAAYRGEALPAAPAKAPVDSSQAEHYAGVYRSPGGETLEFIAANGRLLLKQGEASLPLTPMGRDRFRTSTSDANSFPFFFGRSGARGEGEVMEVSHGAQWYANDRYSGVKRYSTHPEYLAYVGHYENHNAEGPSVRVFVRNGQLVVQAEGEVASAAGEILQPLGSGLFRPAEPQFSPERYRFDTVIEGRALRLVITGTPLYRVDTQ